MGGLPRIMSGRAWRGRRGVAASLWLGGMVWLCGAGCEDRQWQKDAANTAMEIARDDPGRAGKVGAYAALIVRDHAMRLARRRAPLLTDPLAIESPVCLDFERARARRLEYVVHARVVSRGSEELEWEQWITWRPHEDGAEHLMSRERYSDSRAVLDGRRLLDLRWREGERLFRSSMDEAQGGHVRDPMPSSTWRALTRRQIGLMQQAVASISTWQARQDGARERSWIGGRAAKGAEPIAHLVCEGGETSDVFQVDEIIDGFGSVLERASLRREVRDGLEGWAFDGTWKEGERRGERMDVEIWQAMRPVEETVWRAHVMDVERELGAPVHRRPMTEEAQRLRDVRGGGGGGDEQ